MKKKAYVALLVVVLIGLAGFVFVNEMYSTISTSGDLKVVDLPTDSEKETKAKSGSVLPINETVSEYTDENISFQFQSDWTTTDKIGYYNFLENRNFESHVPSLSSGEDIYIISPDSQAVSDAVYYLLKSGRILTMRVRDEEGVPQSIDSLIAETQNGLGKYDGTYEVIQIDGNDAVLASGGSHGISYLNTRVSVGGKIYSFSLESPDRTKISEWDFMKSFLRTVKIK